MVTHKSFTTTVLGLTEAQRERNREALRGLVEQFINREVGSENLVNVTETVMSGFLAVTVWYHRRQQ
jgi:hypothetical protein